MVLWNSLKMTDGREYRFDVIQFVKEVEKFPCIYNTTVPEYSNRSETKRSWCQIAENLAWPEHEIKEKWRKIRIAFMRSLKQQYTHQASKPYYLFDHLKFLLPYIKFSDAEVDHGLSPTNSDYDQLEIGPLKVEMVESDENTEKNDMSDQRSSIVYPTDNCRNDLGNNFPTFFVADRIDPTPDNSDMISYKAMMMKAKKRRCDDNVENNPRKMFLLSLMPEIESFTEEEMRCFRREVIAQIDNIIEKRN